MSINLSRLIFRFDANGRDNPVIFCISLTGGVLAVERFIGVQFHPESILTDEGKKILKNFLEIDR